MNPDGGDSSELEVECNVVTEYGWSLVAAAERVLRYKALLLGAGSEPARAGLRDDYRRFLRRVNDCNRLALVAIGAIDLNERRTNMPHWLKLVLGGLGVAGSVALAAPTGPAGMVAAGVASATAFLTGLYHPTPGAGGQKPQ